MPMRLPDIWLMKPLYGCNYCRNEVSQSCNLERHELSGFASKCPRKSTIFLIVHVQNQADKRIFFFTFLCSETYYFTWCCIGNKCKVMPKRPAHTDGKQVFFTNQAWWDSVSNNKFIWDLVSSWLNLYLAIISLCDATIVYTGEEITFVMTSQTGTVSIIVCACAY